MIAHLLTLALLGGSDLQVIEAEAEAPLSMGFAPAAQRAKDGALRQIILKACKLVAAADPSSSQCAIADDRLFAGFAGLVSKFEVVAQEKVGDVVKVKARAEISLKAVSSEEVEAKRLYERLGGLRLSVGIKELLLQGDRRIPTVDLLSTRIATIFRDEGWKLFPPDEAQKRADYFVTGEIVSELLPPQKQDYDKKGRQIATRARVKGAIQVRDVAADRLVFDVPFEVSGADQNQFDSVAAGLIAQEAPALAAKLRTGLVKALRAAEARGTEIVLTLSGFKTDAQLGALVEQLQRVSGVLSVEPGLLQEGVVRLSVKSAAPAKDLARTISKAMGDKVSISGVRAAAIEGTAR